MSKDVKVMAQGSAVERPSSGLGEGSNRYLVEAAKTLLEGTGRGKCNVYGSKRYTSSTGLTTIDLTSWAADQGTLSFSKVRFVIVVNNSDIYDADLLVGGNAAEPAGLICQDVGEHAYVHRLVSRQPALCGSKDQVGNKKEVLLGE